MKDLLETFEKKQIKKLTSNKRIPAFRSGDLIKVAVKIVEGERSRTQAFEGVCIARKNNGSNSKFTVRKVSHGEGVERVFPLFSPIINSIEVLRKGDVKRAKLYYLRDRTGKSARISHRDRGEELDQYALAEVSIDETENKDKQEIPVDAVNNSEEKNIEKPKIEIAVSDKVKEEVVAKNDKIVKLESESTAIDAAKTEDESKK